MKTLRKIGWVLIGILGIILLIGLVVKQVLKPDYSGEKYMADLQSDVTVMYDPYGIPHIEAQNEADAYRALGYVHAQDRLWQMELLRRVSVGGLSEVFGKDLLATDQFFLSLGIDDASAKAVSELDPGSEMARLSQAYLDGINQFIEEGPTPVEFLLTGLEKKPYEMVDIYNAVGYMAFSFAMAHKTDPLLTIIRDSLGVQYLADLEINSSPTTEWIRNYRGEEVSSEAAVISATRKALSALPVPQFIGSNSWVIGPEKTRSGKVIFANDPHIGFAQPSVWFEAHLMTPSYEKYGYHLAGVPMPLLGHDRNLAYGFTMFENDDIDFFYETLNPEDSTQYLTPSGWKALEVVTKTIKVKDQDDVQFSYRKTERGPILNGIANQITGDRPISMDWIYTKGENRVMEALFGISHARNIEEFKQALPKIHAPGLNTMYGDAEGNVAWWATARLYQLGDSTHTKLVMDGSKGQDRKVRYLDFKENPQAVNPPWNYVYSANNQPDSIAGMLYPGYYLPENRAKRIVSLLDSRNDWDAEAVRDMIHDDVSAVNPGIVTELAKLVDIRDLNEQQALVLDHLSKWNGNYAVDNAEAAVFHRWIYYFLKDTFEDELGEELFSQFISTHFHKRLIAPMATKSNSVWWDDVRTEDVEETKKDMVQSSFLQAFESLQEDLGDDIAEWTWGRLHTLEHPHPIGQIALLRSFFNVGPYPVPGSREVINNMAFQYNGASLFSVTAGPSTRRVIDFSDVENSMSILPTGQSGNPFSKYYRDQAKMFNKGEFRKMMMNRNEIKESASSVLTFKPIK
ncbi:penicillin amidase [Muriicola jejuensis]|uniref:Penicillin acylase family protein n=1 Tax=Muriicola jejuensis TaxID=504488 RepID=A0A6P0UMC9_9FLAO|nr:penicillin acylase family protein [Muriicola jejuensis]NER11416.1 penicillin acylase family protein [Muriicola jejuensis]SMP20885.1 penicillin amidase [Muriicola jejuensis]